MIRDVVQIQYNVLDNNGNHLRSIVRNLQAKPNGKDYVKIHTPVVNHADVSLICPAKSYHAEEGYVKIGEPNASEKGWTSVKQDATAFNTPLRLADADYFYELEYDYGHVSAIRIFSLEHDSEKWYRDIEIPANTTCIDLKQILSPKQLEELDHKNVYEKKCIGLSFLGNDEKTVEEPIEMSPATDGGVKDFGFVDVHGHGDFYRAVEKAGFVWFTETPGGTYNLDVNEKILTVASNSHPLKVRLSRI